MVTEKELFEAIQSFSYKYVDIVKRTNEKTGNTSYELNVNDTPIDAAPEAEDIGTIERYKQEYELQKIIREYFFNRIEDIPELYADWMKDHPDGKTPNIYIRKEEIFSDPESFIDYLLSIYNKHKTPDDEYHDLTDRTCFIYVFALEYFRLIASSAISEDITQSYDAPYLEALQKQIDAGKEDITRYIESNIAVPSKEEKTKLICTTEAIMRPHNKLSQNFSMLSTENQIKLKVANKAGTDIITSVAVVDGEEIIRRYELSRTGNKRSVLKQLTPFDKCVLDRVCSFYEYALQTRKEGDNTTVFLIPIGSIYKKLTNTNTSHPSPEILDAMLKSIDKMQSIRMNIEATEEAKLYTDTRMKAQYGRPLLNAYPDEDRTINKKTGEEIITKCLRMLEQSPYILYAQAQKQITYLSDEERPHLKKNTVESIIISDYLCDQIVYMKYDAKRKHIIKYDTIFELTGTDPKDAKRKAAIRKIIRDILEDLKSKSEYGQTTISGYKEKSDPGSKSITKVEIMFKRNSNKKDELPGA